MVEITGTLQSSRLLENGDQRTVWTIPALSKTGAKQRARANSRVKGNSPDQISDPEVVRQGQIPGQKIYEVAVTTER
jgi:hypothetical protein